jgi:hypothetical protein
MEALNALTSGVLAVIIPVLALFVAIRFSAVIMRLLAFLIITGFILSLVALGYALALSMI